MTRPSATNGTSGATSSTLRSAKRVARRLLPRPAPEPHAWTEASKRYVEPILPIAPSDPSGPTIVLLNDSRDQINFGCQALVEGLLTVVRRAIPNATILPIPSHWLLGTRELEPYVNGGEGFRDPVAYYPSVADEFDVTADDWLEGRGGRHTHEFLDRFRAADLVMLNGEGSIYRINQSAIRELFLVWLAEARLDVPATFVNGSIHLTGVDPVLPAMVRKTFPLLDGVAVREPWSLRNLAEYVPDVPARQFPDAAFAFTADEARETEAVAAVLRTLDDAPYFVFDPGPLPVGRRRGSSSSLHQLISAVKGETYQAVLVCKDPTDRYLEAIARDTGSIYVDSVVDFREYMALTSRAEFSLSGRYHNTILASITGCPTVPFGTASHKVHGVCEVLDGVLGMPHDITYMLPNLDAIVEQSRGYASERSAWRTRLLHVCEQRRHDVVALGAFVGDASRRRVQA